MPEGGFNRKELYMGYLRTVESARQQKLLNMPGTVSEQDWKERAKVTEARYEARTVQHKFRRVKGTGWVPREVPDAV